MPEEMRRLQMMQSEPNNVKTKQVRQKQADQREALLGRVSVLDEFFYPDDCIGALPKELRLSLIHI